jgi:histone H2A
MSQSSKKGGAAHRLAKKSLKSVTRSSRAGLVFPIGRIERQMREARLAKRIGKNASVYMAAVLEYMTAEVLELAGKASTDNHRVRITPRHILLAVGHDPELKELLGGVCIAHAGVLPELYFTKKEEEAKQGTVLVAAGI